MPYNESPWTNGLISGSSREKAEFQIASDKILSTNVSTESKPDKISRADVLLTKVLPQEVQFQTAVLLQLPVH
eukprot:m.95907 g.95907  ORF g.95907 m.95907 type:complete len:73 (+) comp36880_c0_seq8:1183-1401(+)